MRAILEPIRNSFGVQEGGRKKLDAFDFWKGLCHYITVLDGDKSIVSVRKTDGLCAGLSLGGLETNRKDPRGDER